MLRPGRKFADFTIERHLGRGSTAMVYLAHHPQRRHPVALKILDPRFYCGNAIRARFDHEADLATRLVHPGIAAVYDHGDEDGLLWIAVQFVAGSTVSSSVGRLSPERAVAIVDAAADALDYAHALGALHGDVKPANIVLARTATGARVVVTDFGIAGSGQDCGYSTPSMVPASLNCASPERLSGLPRDHRCDQYSLACTLFWLLTGSGPFAAKDRHTVIDGHLRQPPPPPSQRRADLPRTLDPVLTKALTKRPYPRFGSCREFACAAGQALRTAPAVPTNPRPQRSRGKKPTTRV
ncbi:serine/threonine protein kinase [Nocardia sp. CDC159]|uniref:non-specific serine/threonine protein kinase n=1 Tax=Nocardia pulmonis TaxID=2951408 RepID=A0A9X2E9D9_9NOCA|nr:MULTISPECIES: serine/threonine-protein kinase [Nocardia]MCM6775368.1 serine/threonine protein kinase [Nocardia pulmonis]MCM6787898.1 serine/threonine protein kinase [Nocardia sp. CDC159]